MGDFDPSEISRKFESEKLRIQITMENASQLQVRLRVKNTLGFRMEVSE